MARREDQPEVAAANKKSQSVDWEALLARIRGGQTVIEYGANRRIFRQGEPANSVFYLRQGEVKLAVASQQGKEAIVAILGAGEFFGEGCLAGQQLRVSTAIAITDCSLARIDKPVMARMLHEEHDVVGVVRHASAFAQHPIRRGSGRSAFQLQREAPGSDSFIARALWQGK